MKKISKVKLALTSAIVAILSSCVIGVVAYAASSNDKGEFVLSIKREKILLMKDILI